MSTQKTCGACGANVSSYMTFCSKACMGIARRLPPKTCPHCRLEFGGRTGRVFCSRKCALDSRAPSAALVSPVEKRCSKCETVKPLESFSPHKLGAGGVRSICRTCSTAYAMAYNKAHPERAAGATKRHRASPRGKAKRVEWNRESVKRNPAAYMLSRARKRAMQSGVPFTITVSDIVIPERCPVLGTRLVIAEKMFRSGGTGGADDSMSLDRIVPSLGYVPGNVAVISWRANRLKGTGTLQELETLVAWLRTVTPPNQPDPQAGE